MKFYILCDIEGVASLACWDEARSANACYAPMAREMALEAAAAARGLFSGGADEVVIEDMHGRWLQHRLRPAPQRRPSPSGDQPTILWALPVFLTRAMTVC